jgi:TPR repeat protein
MNLISGTGVIKDEIQAQQLLLDASQAGHAKAQLQLGQLFLANDQIIKAKKWLTKASAQQESTATILLEDLVTLEQSKRDDLVLEKPKIEVLSVESVQINSAPTPVVISDSVLSELAINLAPNLSIIIPNQQQILDSLNSNVDAMNNAEKLVNSAQQGNPIAQHNLSILYSIGELVAKDERRAFLLMQQSANQNITRSQNFLAMMYVNGIGVTPNYQKAYYWASVSARKGNTEGKKILIYLVGGSL